MAQEHHDSNYDNLNREKDVVEQLIDSDKHECLERAYEEHRKMTDPYRRFEEGQPV